MVFGALGFGSRAAVAGISGGGAPKANYGPGMQVKMPLPARDLRYNK